MLDVLRDRPQHLVLAALTGGLALSPAPPWAWGAGVVACAALAVAIRRRPLAAVLATFLLAGVLTGQLRLDALRLDDASGPRTGSSRAILLERPRESQFGSAAAIELPDGRHQLAVARDELSWPEGVAPGAELIVRGTAAVPPAPEPGEFDRRGWLWRRGIGAELSLTAVQATGGRRGGLAGLIDSMRGRAEAAIDRGLGASQAALLRGMVLGEDEQISSIVRDDFRRSGLAHLLAVSGQNVMLLGMLALPLLIAAGARPGTRIAVLIGLIALYVPLAGAGPSLQRAGIMGAAGLVALAAGRPESRWYSLLLAAAITLGLNPLAAGDPGWQLSFAAVAGIVLVAPGIRGRLSAWPRPLAEALAMTVAATLATAPLLAAHFEAVSPASLPANVLALPAVAPVMWLGMIATGVGQLAALGPPFDTLSDVAASAIGWLAAVPLDYLAGLAAWAASLPWAQLDVRAPSFAGVAAGFAGVAGATFAARFLVRRIETPVTALMGARRTLGRAHRSALAATAVALACMAALPLVEPPAAPTKLTVRFLDVGQGDATLIQDPSGAAVLFDGGRADARVANLLRNAGVRRLALVVATHHSADHHGGLAEVLRRFPVDLLLENGDDTTDPTFAELLATARTAGVPIRSARTGQVLRAGGLTVRVLWPPPRAAGPAPEDPNPRAVVAIVSAGAFDLFLSADAESSAILPLELPPVEAMKVPHHGSSDPGLPEVLDRLRPRLAAIEVGENSYGHPHPSTLAALRAARVPTYRTDRDGTVSLTIDQRGIEVATAR